jgi:hypothetical protein
MLSLVLVAVFGTALPVRGATACPTAPEVAEALASLLPSSAEHATGDSAELLPDGDGVRVRLLQADGTVLAEKQLAAGSCKQMAEKAGVVLAAWESQLHPEVALAIEAPPAALSLAAPALATRPVLSARMPSPPAAAPSFAFAMGVGVLASFQGDTVAPAAALDARVYGRQSGWGAKLALRGSGTHRLALGPGEAEWRRLGVAAGVLRRATWRHVSAEAGVDLLSGWLFVEGDGYTVGQSARSWDFGAEVGGRIGFPLGRAEPWIGVAGAAWLRPQLVEVSGLPAQGRLPALEARVGAGVSIAWEP